MCIVCHLNVHIVYYTKMYIVYSFSIRLEKILKDDGEEAYVEEKKLIDDSNATGMIYFTMYFDDSTSFIHDMLH